MAGNRKLVKTNFSSHRSETTERNERLNISLTRIAAMITAIAGAISFH
jgi:hypothetical protein